MGINKLFLLIFMIFSSISAFSCQKDKVIPEIGVDHEIVEGYKYLYSVEPIGKFKKAELSKRFTNFPGSKNLLKYDISVVKLNYTTTNAFGKEVIASGLVIIPENADKMPFVSMQHGTITSDLAAPSNYNKGSEAYGTGSLLASNGYIISAPDYIGYGTSRDEIHPYEHRASLAKASFDMLMAAKEYVEKEKISHNNKLFLTGYSEGGFATMSLLKYMEEKHKNEFEIAAAIPGAGAYNKVAFARYIMGKSEPLNFINSYIWVLDTYNMVYGINHDYNFFFNEPFATDIKKYGVHTSVEKNPEYLFTPKFRDLIMNGSEDKFFDALKDNNVYDWKPTVPLYLIHGTADDYVPFFNSSDAYKAMKARGAEKVELIPIEGGDHFSSGIPFGQKLFEILNRLR